MRTTGSWVQLRDENGTTYPGRVRGKMRLEGSTKTNPIAVNDWVEFELEEQDAEPVAWITKICQRKNFLLRKSTRKSEKSQIIAANLDQVLLVTTLIKPSFKPGFVDRLLVMAEAYQIPVCILFNKFDLLDSQLQAIVEEWKAIYENIGYPVFLGSSHTGLGIDALQSYCKGKTTLLAGQSGVGKSSLINKLIPEIDLKVGSLSTSTEKGQHTTTFATMFGFEKESWLIDTPGVKEYGLVDVRAAELGHFFPEFFRIAEDCKFHNCRHFNEPDCSVDKAFREGRIAESRYKNYLGIIQELE